MNQLTPTEAAYLAGLFDGEGHAGLHRIVKNGTPKYVAGVTITNTDREMIQWCLDITGIGICTHTQKSTHKIVYIWKLRTPEMSTFLYTVFPYLRSKKKRVILLLEYLNNCIGNTTNSPSIEMQNWRELIYRDLKALNKRGIDCD